MNKKILILLSLLITNKTTLIASIKSAIPYEDAITDLQEGSALVSSRTDSQSSKDTLMKKITSVLLKPQQNTNLPEPLAGQTFFNYLETNFKRKFMRAAYVTNDLKKSFNTENFLPLLLTKIKKYQRKSSGNKKFRNDGLTSSPSGSSLPLPRCPNVNESYFTYLKTHYHLYPKFAHAAYSNKNLYTAFYIMQSTQDESAYATATENFLTLFLRYKNNYKELTY